MKDIRLDKRSANWQAMNDTRIYLLATGIAVLFIVLFLVKSGYVKQADRINAPAAAIGLGVALAGAILAWLGSF